MIRPLIGEAAPSVELVDSTGATWHLADQLGHSVVLIFHRHIH